MFLGAVYVSQFVPEPSSQPTGQPSGQPTRLTTGELTELQKVVASDGAAEDLFGTHVAMDGNILAAGARHSGGKGKLSRLKGVKLVLTIGDDICRRCLSIYHT